MYKRQILFNKLRRFIEDLLFFQIIIGAGMEDDDSHGKEDQEEKERRNAKSNELSDAVVKYAAHRALEESSGMRWMFPKPELRVSTAIDADTLGNTDQDDSEDLNKCASPGPTSHQPGAHTRTRTTPRT